jgi:hypothetical protein
MSARYDFRQLVSGCARMTDRPLQSIVHPTDFSQAGLDAFAHALRLAVAAKSHFHILHIDREDELVDWVQFPRVREMLAAWGMIAPDAPRSAVASELGLKVSKVIIESNDPVRSVGAFARKAARAANATKTSRGCVRSHAVKSSLLFIPVSGPSRHRRSFAAFNMAAMSGFGKPCRLAGYESHDHRSFRDARLNWPAIGLSGAAPCGLFALARQTQGA